MARGNPAKGLLNHVLRVVYDLGPDKVHSSLRVSQILKRSGEWEGKNAKTPERTINSYFTQNPEIFKKIGTDAYKLRPEKKIEYAHLFKQKLKENYLSIEDVRSPEEIPTSGTKFTEGASTRVEVNRYERDPKARAQCIEHWGALCAVCSFSFVDVYGEIGEGFIHVHHIKPISEIGKTYGIDPIDDLVPVCPNCHAMLHKTTPPLGIKQLQETMKKESRTRRVTQRR